jgi:hypothetical protein
MPPPPTLSPWDSIDEYAKAVVGGNFWDEHLSLKKMA